MGPLRIIVRVVFGYLFLLVLMRLSGKRALSSANPFDFTLALVLGELVDSLIGGDAGVAMFAVATSVLMSTHVAFDYVRSIRT